MNRTRPSAPSAPSVEPPVAEPLGPKGGVRIQKRPAAPAPSGEREKPCSRCGRMMMLGPDEKFYLCPDCYQKVFVKKPRRQDARVLIQIHCTECGAQEYLDFQPPDPTAALCRNCFARRRREP